MSDASGRSEGERADHGAQNGGATLPDDRSRRTIRVEDAEPFRELVETDT